MNRKMSTIQVDKLIKQKTSKPEPQEEHPAVVETQKDVTRVFSRREKLELETKLRRMKELEASHKEYEKLYEELKKRFKHVHNLKLGDFLITGEFQSRKESIIPAMTFWKMKIIKL